MGQRRLASSAPVQAKGWRRSYRRRSAATPSGRWALLLTWRTGGGEERPSHRQPCDLLNAQALRPAWGPCHPQ